MKWVLVVTVCVCLLGCGESREDSAEYQQMAYDHMKMVTEDPDIDSITLDGSLLYINFSKPQPESEYLLVAESNAIRFSNFKHSELGVSGVTVYCTYGGRIVAEASARGGEVTGSKVR